MGFPFARKAPSGINHSIASFASHGSCNTSRESYAASKESQSTMVTRESQSTFASNSTLSTVESNGTRSTILSNATRSTAASKYSKKSAGSDSSTDALNLSEASNQALLAAKAILNAGGSDATALRTARAAALAHLIPDNKEQAIYAGVGISFLRNRKLKRQADVVAAMALGSALVNRGVSSVNSHSEDIPNSATDWDYTVHHDNDIEVRPAASMPAPYSHPVRPATIMKKHTCKESVTSSISDRSHFPSQQQSATDHRKPNHSASLTELASSFSQEISQHISKSFTELNQASNSSRRSRASGDNAMCVLFPSAQTWLQGSLSDDSLETDFHSALEDGTRASPQYEVRSKPFFQPLMESVMSSLGCTINCSTVPSEVKVSSVRFDEQITFYKEHDIPNVISINSTKTDSIQSEDSSNFLSKASESSDISATNKVLREILANAEEPSSGGDTPRPERSTDRLHSIRDAMASAASGLSPSARLVPPSMLSPHSRQAPSSVKALPPSPPSCPPKTDPEPLPIEPAYEEHIEIFTVPSRTHRFSRLGYNQLDSPEPAKNSKRKQKWLMKRTSA